MPRKATLQVVEGTAYRGAAPSTALDNVIGYRGLHALCTTEEAKDGASRLKATHWAACTIAGKNPVWCVWTAAGKFLRFYGSRGQIERAYPTLTWRRKMCSWHLLDTRDLSIAARREELSRRYRHDVNEETSPHD